MDMATHHVTVVAPYIAEVFLLICSTESLRSAENPEIILFHSDHPLLFISTIRMIRSPPRTASVSDVITRAVTTDFSGASSY